MNIYIHIRSSGDKIFRRVLQILEKNNSRTKLIFYRLLVLLFAVPITLNPFLSTYVQIQIQAGEQSEKVFTIDPPLADVFVAQTTQNGNRRMHFAGTYIDHTICSPEEGCPPVYKQARTLMKFEMELPEDAIPLRGELLLYHYGSNEELSVVASRITEQWDEQVSFPGPEYEGNYGQALIPKFNTNRIEEVAERKVPLNQELLLELLEENNGFLIRPEHNPDDPGITFCSKDFDDVMCAEEHVPQLQITYIINNKPLTPELHEPEDTAKITGNCNESVVPAVGTCRESMPVQVTVGNIQDNDPYPGDLKGTLIEVLRGEDQIHETDLIRGSGVVTEEIRLSDGVYQWRARSVDNLQKYSDYSNVRNITLDTTPPVIPVVPEPPPLTKLAANASDTQIAITVPPIQDNITDQEEIEYLLEYSDESDFTVPHQTIWQSTSAFSLKSAGIDGIANNADDFLEDKTYYFRVKARDTMNNISAWSDVVYTTIYFDVNDIKPLIPILNKTNWGIKDGIEADGKYPERSRFNSDYVIRSKSVKLTGMAMKNQAVTVFVNGRSSREVKAASTPCRKLQLEENYTITLCSFTTSFTFNDTGEDGANGEPVHKYSFQFQSSNEKGDKSHKSPMTGIFHESAPPPRPITTWMSSSSHNPLINWPPGKKTVQTRNNQINGVVQVERLTDIKVVAAKNGNQHTDSRVVKNIYGNNHRYTIRLGTNSKDTGSCIRTVNGKRVGVCGDGKYEVVATSFDGPGNKSSSAIYVERDTVAPNKPKVTLSLCGSNICGEISGEKNSSIYIRNKKYGAITSSSKKITIVKNWYYNREYSFEVTVRDSVGNTSARTKATIKTPEPIYYRGGIDGANKENPHAGKTGSNCQEIRFNTRINANDKTYSLSNINIPAPQLTFILTSFNKNVSLYGVSLPKRHTITTNIEVSYSTYNESVEQCGNPISPGRIACIEEKMGIDNLWKWDYNVILRCYGIYNFPCREKVYANERVVKDKGEHEFQVHHVMVHFKNEPAAKKPIGSLWNDNKEGKFRHEVLLGDHVNVNDRVQAQTVIFGEFTFEGVTINYRGKNTQEAGKNHGLRSGWSNELIVDKSEFINLKGHQAKVLPVPYFNQWLEPNGSYHPPKGKWMCGAASSVMVAGYFGKLDYDKNNEYSLKKYMYADNGQRITTTCGHLMGGAFGLTNYTCNQSWAPGMQKYAEHHGLKWRYLAGTVRDSRGVYPIDPNTGGYINESRLTFEEVRDSIDNGRPIIIGFKRGNIGHIIPIIGYTSDGKIVVNDSYKDVQNSAGSYSNNGKHAIYNLDDWWTIYYALEISL
ncbi:MAG: C39 family peptidase [Candidatus Dojkabacteria bacterium]